jgi:hypothetical protein
VRERVGAVMLKAGIPRRRHSEPPRVLPLTHVSHRYTQCVNAGVAPWVSTSRSADSSAGKAVGRYR